MPLLKGDSPVILGDGRILFVEYADDGRSHKWKTCDMEGKNVQQFGDGLGNFAFPTRAPDGQRILMMQFIPRRGATPYVFRIGQAPGEPAVRMGGSWGRQDGSDRDLSVICLIHR